MKNRYSISIKSRAEAEDKDQIESVMQEFAQDLLPLEDTLFVHLDKKTKARYCECHINAKKLVELSTIDVPLDPEEQPDYRANREIMEDATAFEQMKTDALAGRTFSNIVAEYDTNYDSEHPLKIIGGQPYDDS